MWLHCTQKSLRSLPRMANIEYLPLMHLLMLKWLSDVVKLIALMDSEIIQA